MAADIQYGALPVISVAGRELDGELETLLEQTIVDGHLHLPDMFELRFRDEMHDLLTLSGMEIGEEIEIAATPVGRETSALPLCKGEICAIETEYESSSGSHTVVRGYDTSHRLMKRTHTRAWERATITEILRDVVGDTPVRLGTVAGDTSYEYVSQYNETDFAFLKRLAEESGQVLTVELGELHLREPPDASSAPIEGDLRQDAQPLQLVLGSNLRSLRVRVTTAGQTPNVEVRAWDYVGKRALVGRAAATASRSAEAGIALSSIVGAFQATDVLSCERPHGSEQQVTAAAQSLAALVAASYAEAFGVLTGNPAVRAGKAISISNVGDEFDGSYIVTAARHVFDDEGFATHFEITGRQDRSVLRLTGGAPAARRRIDGVVIGIVTNVRDPDRLGRVKLTFPWLDDRLESAWARVAMQDAGTDNRGMLILPEVDDECVVSFEHGDPDRPVVVGRLYNGQDRPPVNDDLIDATTGRVNRREYRSRLGHEVVFADDAATRSGIEIRTADGRRTIHLDEKGGKLVLEVQRSTIEIGDSGDLKIDASANVTITAQGNLELEATNVKINGRAQTEIKGGRITLN